MNYKHIIRINHLILMIFVVTLLGLTVTGCKNTANGAGKDIEKMGEKLQEKTQ